MNIRLTDCGRTQGEKLDCTVRATASCLGLSYVDAHARLKTLGRKDGRRFAFWKVTNQLNLNLRSDLSCMTLRKALPEMKQGNFIVRVRGHVFAVIDGVIIDTMSPNFDGHIKMVYEKI